MVRLSLRARVLAGMALVVVALAVVGVIVTRSTGDTLVDQIDSRLDAAAPFGGDGRGEPGGPGRPGGGPYERPSDVFQGLLDTDGALQTWYTATDVPAIGVEDATEGARSRRAFTVGAVGDDGKRFRLRADAGPDGGYFVTAIPLADVDDTIGNLITVEVIAGLIVLALLAAVAWWVVRLGIRPIKQMTKTAEQIASGDLSQRVPEAAASTEAGQLGLALNHMLERLDTAFTERAESQARLHRFVADASHELRTPVTTIRGYAELYRVGGLAERSELDEAMRRTEQEAVRMARLVDDLLSLAKFDQGRPLEQRPVDLTRLVADAARDAGAVDPGRTITTDLDGPVVVAGDEDRLRQVVANIVGNALVHTPAATPIELRVTANGGGAQIAVSDHGPGMSPDVAARVTQRFYRADPARARDRGGSGLGMSIADAAVAAHGGAIAVDSMPGRGTTVTVTLPRSTASSQVVLPEP
ncbi:MAG: ATP-binding protein [Ilumatobacteraceae bacterium]